MESAVTEILQSPGEMTGKAKSKVSPQAADPAAGGAAEAFTSAVKSLSSRAKVLDSPAKAQAKTPAKAEAESKGKAKPKAKGKILGC